MTFQIGKLFFSFPELKAAVEEYTKIHNVHFYMRDAHKLGSSYDVSRCKNAKKELIYYKLKYACVYGGRKHLRRKDFRGERKSHSIRYGCKAFINVLLSPNGDALEVTDLDLEHCHPNFQDVAKLHVMDRPISKRRLKRMLGSSVSKPTKKYKIQTKPVSVSNTSSESVQQSFSSEKNIQFAFRKICQENSMRSNMLLDGGKIKVAFLQDDEMKRTFSAFPEVMFFNRTCTVTNVNLICFTFLTIGVQGENEVVAIGFVTNEDKHSLDWLINSFKESNENWCKIQILMTDKDLVEQNVFEDKFPHTAISICRYSVLQVFKQEVTSVRLNITSPQVTNATKLLLQMCNSTSEEQYLDFYDKFQSFPSTLTEYFDENWHPFRKEWTCISFYDNNFIADLNNKLETFNTKLNDCIGDLSNLEIFIRNYLSLIKSLRNERDNASVNPNEVKRYLNQVEIDYFKLLVTYAFKTVLNHLRDLHIEEFVEVFPSQYYFSQDGVLFRVDQNTCDCIFTKTMRLPCKHIFSVRRKMNISVFDPSLVDPRWIRPDSSNGSSHSESDEVISEETLSAQKEVNAGKEKMEAVQGNNTLAKDQQARLKEALVLTNELAFAISESTEELYKQRMSLVESILSHWKKGGGVTTFTVGPNLKTIPTSQENIRYTYGGSFKSILPKPNAPYIVKQSEQNSIVYLMNGHSIPSSSITTPQSLESRNRFQSLSENVSGRKKTTEPQPFEKLPLHVKQKIILSWFVDKSLASHTVSNGGIIEENVLLKPDLIPSFCTDKRVDLTIVKSFFSEDAWKQITSIADGKKKNKSKICASCCRSITIKSIRCSSCLSLYHHQCTAYKKLQIDKFCKKCVVGFAGSANMDGKTEPQPFEKLPLLVRQKKILSWFVDKDLASHALNDGRVIEEHDVLPSEVPSSYTDRKVDLSSVQNFFSEDAWKLVTSIVNLTKNKKDSRSCVVCGSLISKELVKCSFCLLYCHHKCVEYRKPPVSRDWFCKKCKTVS